MRTYRSTLTHAISVAGEEALARRLRVPVAQLILWISGAEPVPGDIFLAAVDVVQAGARQKNGPVHKGGEEMDGPWGEDF